MGTGHFLRPVGNPRNKYNSYNAIKTFITYFTGVFCFLENYYVNINNAWCLYIYNNNAAFPPRINMSNLLWGNIVDTGWQKKQSLLTLLLQYQNQQYVERSMTGFSPQIFKRCCLLCPSKKKVNSPIPNSFANLNQFHPSHVWRNALHPRMSLSILMNGSKPAVYVPELSMLLEDW